MMASNNNLGMDKSTLKVHLPDGSFNVVRFGDATDIKVCSLYSGVLKIFFNFSLWLFLLLNICVQRGERGYV